MFAMEGHVGVMYSKVVSKVAQLWELQRAKLALKQLVHTLGFLVHTTYNEVVSHVHDLLTVDNFTRFGV
jgi:hypothetical protein